MASTLLTLFGMSDNAALKWALVSAISSMLLIVLTKPQFVYKADGTPKDFGTSKNQTIAPMWVVGTAVGILVYIGMKTSLI